MQKIASELYKTNIFKNYRKLTHIIYKNNYLIPQRLYAQATLSFSANLTLKELYLRVHPEKKTVSNIETEILKADFNSILAKCQDGYLKEKEKHDKKLLQYFNNLIKPIKHYERKITAFDIFKSEQAIKRAKEMEGEPKPLQSTLIEQFNRLSDQIKNKYELEAKNFQEKVQKHVQTFLIPQRFTKADMYLIYQSKQANPKKYSELSRSQVQLLQFETQKRNKEFLPRFQKFLKRHQLQEANFDQIKLTCDQFLSEIQTLAKKSKIKELENLDFINDEVLLLDQTRVEEPKEEPKKIRSKTKAVESEKVEKTDPKLAQNQLQKVVIIQTQVKVPLTSHSAQAPSASLQNQADLNSEPLKQAPKVENNEVQAKQINASLHTESEISLQTAIA